MPNAFFKNPIFEHASKTAITLIAFAFVGTLLLAFVFEITRAPIQASEREARLALFKQILPESTYDNALLKETVIIPPNAQLGNLQPTTANIAKMNHRTVGVILEAIAHDGYSGDIKLLIAIRADGSISGVRVLTHKETPGLGDYIDIAHGDWIKPVSYTHLDVYKRQPLLPVNVRDVNFACRLAQSIASPWNL